MVLTPNKAKKKAMEERKIMQNPAKRLEGMIDTELVRNNGWNTRFELSEDFEKRTVEEVLSKYGNAGWNTKYEEPCVEDSSYIHGYISLERRG